MNDSYLISSIAHWPLPPCSLLLRFFAFATARFLFFRLCFFKFHQSISLLSLFSAICYLFSTELNLFSLFAFVYCLQLSETAIKMTIITIRHRYILLHWQLTGFVLFYSNNTSWSSIVSLICICILSGNTWTLYKAAPIWVLSLRLNTSLNGFKSMLLIVVTD